MYFDCFVSVIVTEDQTNLTILIQLFFKFYCVGQNPCCGFQKDLSKSDQILLGSGKTSKGCTYKDHKFN